MTQLNINFNNSHTKKETLKDKVYKIVCESSPVFPVSGFEVREILDSKGIKKMDSSITARLRQLTQVGLIQCRFRENCRYKEWYK